MEADVRLNFNVVPVKTAEAFKFCATVPLFAKNHWYLAGGTALALQVGHRESVDLDFFTTEKTFESVKLERELLSTGKWQTTFSEDGTVFGEILGAKISFIAYPFFYPAEPKLDFGKVSMLRPADIAVMKIIAMSQRGKKRDFIDLYWYIKNREPLVDIIRRVLKQYPGQDHNLPHFLKSLTYFVDAESEPMPNTNFTVSWPEVKKFFQVEAVRATRELVLPR